MSTLRFSRLHFFKRFQPDAEYIVLKDMLLSGVEVKRGDVLDKSLLPTHKIKRLFEARKITPDYSFYDPADISTIVESKTDKPVIVKAGPRWRKVMLGEIQIGKTVGTDDEALAIIATWEEENK